MTSRSPFTHTWSIGGGIRVGKCPRCGSQTRTDGYLTATCLCGWREIDDIRAGLEQERSLLEFDLRAEATPVHTPAGAVLGRLDRRCRGQCKEST